MKILLGVATYPTEPHVYPASQASIDALELGDHHVDISYYGDDDPALDPKDNITAKHNRMRADVLSSDYDALLTIEADIIVPPDALTKLAAVCFDGDENATTRADVIYGAYCSRSHPMLLTFPTINGYKGRSISADDAEWRDKFGTVIDSEGIGFGCTLISRRVLEQVEFRRDTSTAMRRRFADDWTFALDVKAAGFKSATHLGVLCGHIQRDGGVRWVDPDAPQFMRVEGVAAQPQQQGAPLPSVARYRVRKWLFGPTRQFAPGTEIELNAEAAAILLAGNKIEII